MNQIAKNHEKGTPMVGYKADCTSGTAIKPARDKKKINLLPWVGGIIFIISMLYCSSYLALLWLPAYEGMDVKSQLTADYGPWTFMIFQPVDPAIIDEIKQERGLPVLMVVDGGALSTPVPTATPPLPASSAASFTPRPTNDDPSAGPTVLQTTHTLTSIPTRITSVPEVTVTPQSTQVVGPPKSGKPPKTPKPRKTPKPHKTPDPK